MQATELPRGAVVQIDPENTLNPAFGGCMLVITESRPAYAMGYVQGIGDNRDELGGQAFTRMPWEWLEPVGQANWMIYGGEND